MKRTLRRYWISAIMTLFLMVLTAAPAWAANKGPNMDSSFIYLSNSEVSNSIYLWQSPNSSGSTGSIKGIKYDLAANTLRLEDVDMPYATLEVLCMGDDFKVNVAGTNSLSRITVIGSGYGGNIEFTGNGTLELNKNINEDEKTNPLLAEKPSLTILAENTEGRITIGPDVHLTVYKQNRKYVLSIEGSTESQAPQSVAGESLRRRLTFSLQETLALLKTCESSFIIGISPMM